MNAARLMISYLIPLAAAVAFTRFFDFRVNVAWVNLLWLFGVVCSVAGHAAPGRAGALPWRRTVPLLVLLVAVTVCWLPFYDNWRWVGGGDSLGWFLIPERAAQHGPPLSVLSVAGGPFEFFTFTSVIVDNALMFLFEPTFFWHRASKLALTLLALASMYAYFATVWRPCWAVALCVAAATNFLLIWLSFLSFNHIDSFFFAYLTLLMTALILRDPARTWSWAAAGALGGLSLLFTGTAWTDVVACGAVLLVFGLLRRRWRELFAYAVAAFVAALPVLLQLSEWIARQVAQSKLGPELEMGYWEHRLWIARVVLTLPLGGATTHLDPNLYFFFWPAGVLYLAGMGLALLSLVPWTRRTLDLPKAAAGLLALYLWSVFLQAMTTNYGWPSWKRSFHLIPLQIFFALLPLTAVAALLRRWRVLHVAAVATVFALVSAYGAANVEFFVHPQQRNWGNEIDGLVQLHQRYLHRPVTVFAPAAVERAFIEDPLSDLNRAYRLHRSLRPEAPLELVETLDPVWLAQVCPSDRILCYKMTPTNKASFDAVARDTLDGMRRVEVFWNAHFICYECAAADA